MIRLTMILFSMVATTLMGIGGVIVLSIGKDTWQPISSAAAVGFILAIPVSYYAARQMIGKFSEY